jgi:hypothetical protein
MNTLRLSAMAAVGFAVLLGSAVAQQPTSLPPLQSQSLPPPTGTQTVQPFVPPPPQLLPSASAFTTCTMNCDTQAMNCLGTCVPTPTAPTTTTPAAVPSTGSCNLSCTTQQLVCKQRC